jgi:predicted CoA-substrate-specific enzyme activase
LAPDALRAGLDVGSTTAKLVVLGADDRPLFASYRRHRSDIIRTVAAMFNDAAAELGDMPVRLALTGSAGMGVAEAAGLPFVQEVNAAIDVVRRHAPGVTTLIDIGGEDSKMVFFSPRRPPDIRMNGRCAGGTGAFIDQMAGLLGISLEQMDALAAEHREIHPIASRCGVFAKTDVQNLLSRKISLPDICASILHAIVLQNLASLARGVEIRPTVLLAGGPLTFLPSLRGILRRALGLAESDILLPQHSQFIPAWGAALAIAADAGADTLRVWRAKACARDSGHISGAGRLPALFGDQAAFASWETRRAVADIPMVGLREAAAPLFVGIDSGSTTTKFVVLDNAGRMAFHSYRPNLGNPLDAVGAAFREFREAFAEAPAPPIGETAVTGYGEDLIRAAFNLNIGVVETVAHWRGAARFDPDVSFILDIGGQDMKAIFLDAGGIQRIEINEACSSGCGSFIEGFAQTLGLSAEEFAARACRSRAPCDLGTRCTVFMNSRIKQAQRENAAVEDVAAGLAYAVVKNALYKVLKLRDPGQAGGHIVVQGGTFRNLAVVRALELLLGRPVSASRWPELMGAYGAALLAQEACSRKPEAPPLRLEDFCAPRRMSTRATHCGGCLNKCAMTVFQFQDGRKYFLGNKCERVFTNRDASQGRGTNLFTRRNSLVFDRNPAPKQPRRNVRIGVPRILEMFETFPFWAELLTGCGFVVELSPASSQALYERGLASVMSDNICFPAKLAHGHVAHLVEAGVDRILYPHVVYSACEDDTAANSYNCPIVSAYSEVLRGSLGLGQNGLPPLDAPTISFRDGALLKRACAAYLQPLGVPPRRFRKAFAAALRAQAECRRELLRQSEAVIAQARGIGRPLIVLAGRPYHADPLIEHQTSEILADLGVDTIPADVASEMAAPRWRELASVSQWTYPNRLLRAAQWVADQPDAAIQYVMLTSFGCGPDAFIMDEIRDVLNSAGKIFTLIKVDDISSVGSIRLRLRSLIETLRWRPPAGRERRKAPASTPSYTRSDRTRTLIAPYFADCYTPFVAPGLHGLGYDLRVLPPPDAQSVELGMRYTNNEVCYPAILIVGDVIKAFRDGGHDPRNTAVALTQTGGQCRATSYVSLVKRSLVSAGYRDVPVVAITGQTLRINDQPGFRLSPARLLKRTVHCLLYADAIAHMYSRCVVRERRPGGAKALRDRYLRTGAACIGRNEPAALPELLAGAVADFNAALADVEPRPRVAVIGEIYVKYNAFSQMHATDWLISQNVEVIVPSLMDFFLQFFVNAEENRRDNLARGFLVSPLEAALEHLIGRWSRVYHAVMERFRLNEIQPDIHRKAALASEIVSLANQYGEGWLIPAEIASLATMGIHNVVCVQPFGCIANHMVAKGVERLIRQRYPLVNLLFLDFDAGTSEVNFLNRLHYMIDNLKTETAAAQAMAL